MAQSIWGCSSARPLIASASATSASRRSIGDAVKNLERIKVKDLTRLLNNLEASQNYAPKAFSAGKEE